MTRNGKFGIGATLLVAAIGSLMYAGVQQSSVYYFTIGEFIPRKDDLVGQGVRVAGRVSAGSLWQQTSSKGTEMKFAIGDFEGEDGHNVPLLPVHFTGVVPDMFAEGRDVIVEGQYVDGIMHAKTIMTSCPSKYEPNAPGAADGDGRRAAN